MFHCVMLSIGIGIVGAWSCASASAQISDARYASSKASFAMTIGLENTQFPAYADNALGFDFATAYQVHPLLGAEFRMGAYPVSARYDQVPITGGYSIAVPQVLGHPFTVFGYAGGGVSRSESEESRATAATPQWRTCVQVDAGLDRDFGRLSWRVLQVLWRHTYSTPEDLRSVGLSTGLVYHFAR